MRIGVDGINYLAHRLAWLYVTGNWPTTEVDHRDGNPSNNQFANLRDVSQQTNIENMRAATKGNRTSGLLGVSYHRRDNLWRARIRINGKDHIIGYFKTPEAAHSAYLEEKRQKHAGCTI